MPTGNSKFPGLDQKYVMEIEQRTANVPAGVKEIMQQRMYSDFYAQQKREEEQAERMAMKNQITQKELEAKSDEKAALRITNKKATLADGLRNFYKLNLSDGDDDTLISKFTSGIKDGDKMYIDYLNGDNNDIMVKTGLFGDVFKQLNEKQKVGMTPNVSNTVTEAQNKPKPTNLTSTSHFDDPEYAAHYLQNVDKEYKPFVDAARQNGYPDWMVASMVDASKTYQDFLQRGFGDKAEEVNVGTFQGFVNFFGNAYNNLAGNNPYVGIAPKLNMDSIQFSDDLLGATNNYGDLRAESGWTKGGEIFGDLLANTAVMMLLPGVGGEAKMESLAESALNNGTKGVVKNLTQRGIYGAAEGAEFGALATMGQENADLDKLGTNMTAGATLGSVFGVAGGGLNAYKYRNILRTSLKEGDKANTVKNLLEMFDKGVKPTSRGMKTNTQLQQYNDDALGAVETIIKNKDGLKYIDINGEETFGHLPRNLDEFSQAIKQTKQSIYNDYTAIAREAGKETSVDTSNIVKDLKSKLNNKEGTAGWDDATKARIQKWIRDLEELNNTMSVEGTQNKIQELNQKIQTFIKNGNPNDVGTNAVDGWVLNGLKSSLDDAIENAGLDSEQYFALRNAYKQLKAIESDVNHRTIVYGRQNPESLVDSMANLSSIDAIAKFLKNPKEGALKFAGSQLEKISAKSRNNPNKIIDKMFREADDTISKSDTLKTQAQLAGERTEKQAYNIRKNRAQRLQERQEAYNSKEQARQALLEKQQQQEAAYQEYLKGKGVGSETQALPQREGVNNYNTIIADNGAPTVVTPEGTAIRQGQIAETPTKNVNYAKDIPEDKINIQKGEVSASEANKSLDNANITNNKYYDSNVELIKKHTNGGIEDVRTIDKYKGHLKEIWDNAGPDDYVVLRHNTKSDRVDSIIDNGIQSRATRGDTSYGEDAPGLNRAIADENLKNPWDDTGYGGNEIYFRIKKKDAEKYFANKEALEFFFPFDIKPEDIVAVNRAVKVGDYQGVNSIHGLYKYIENAKNKWGMSIDELAGNENDYIKFGTDLYNKVEGNPLKTYKESKTTKTPQIVDKNDTMNYSAPTKDLAQVRERAYKNIDNVIEKAKSDGLEPGTAEYDKVVGDELYKEFEDSFDDLLTEHMSNPNKEANLIDPDELRYLVNNDQKLPAGVTHPIVKELADRQYKKVVNELMQTGKKNALVMGGGSGAGKGFVRSNYKLAEKGFKDGRAADIIVDKVSGVEEANELVKKGFDVQQYGVIPRAENVVLNIAQRAYEKGRGLSIPKVGREAHLRFVDQFLNGRPNKGAISPLELYANSLNGEGKYQLKLLGLKDHLVEVPNGKGSTKYVPEAGGKGAVEIPMSEWRKALEDYEKEIGVELSNDKIEKVVKERFLDTGKIDKSRYKELVTGISGLLLLGLANLGAEKEEV